MIIAIDGPAGSGKTTVAKLLAKKLNISYLDTGATYRALTLKALESNTVLSDRLTLHNMAKSLNLKFEGEKVILDGEDVSKKIRTPAIDKNISVIVSYFEIRGIMVDLQRKLSSKGDFVVEGRDITTVVFPNAEFKFYLDADFNVRAQRRFKESKEKGAVIKFEELKKDMANRDAADMNRQVGALKISPDATLIDTTDLTINGTVEVLTQHINSDRKA